MMKRTGPRLGPDEPSPIPQSAAQIQQAGASNMHTLAQSAQPQLLGATAMLSVSGGFSRGPARANAPAVINYLKPNTVQYAPKQPPQVPPRLKLVQQPAPLPIPGRQSPGLAAPLAAQPAGQFQRLKVEDALSYLDQVKYKFNTQPQVYNDFLDIMKEFKSQTVGCRIDTPGVITRVSNLFKGHPELIVGFNTFLPPGYKIEVQSNGQVSVSMPSPTGAGCGPVGVGGVGGVGVSAVSGGGGGGGGSGVLLGVHHPPPQSQLVHLLPVPQSVSTAIVHNLSVNATPANTLHHISQAHQQIEAAAIHHPPGSAPSSAAHAGAAAGQPVEFNHAIEYVNKIKSRFSRQPDKYKRFLEILHAYQRGHRDVKEPQAKQQTEQEVYSQVAKLFENQDDLLAEFGQFLPDAKAVTKPAHIPPHSRSPPPQTPVAPREEERYAAASPPPHAPHSAHAPHAPHVPHAAHAQLHHAPPLPKHTSAPPAPPQHHHLKRSPSFGSSTQIDGYSVRVSNEVCAAAGGAPPPKKARAGGASPALRDVSLADAAKLATAHDYGFFDRARKALRSQHIYENFLRCLLLFTNEIISSSELLCVTEPFLYRHPELKKWLQDFVGPVSPPHTPTTTHTGYNNFSSTSSLLSCERSRLGSETKRHEPLGAYGAQLRHERPQGDAAMDIDLSTCKRLGTSYCALPREAAARRCSGRTPLCKEVLNDTWVSFPTWSEDSTFVTSRKTQFEEYIYRCEDERFELDVVIETNAATIRVLEGVQKKLSRMTSEDAAKYRLDDSLGGHSPTIHQRALRRIYGDKVAVDIIAGLKKNPVVAVPVVLRRLKAKEEEWREAQKGFNKQWREQNEKYYLKSLDHQGINFKQNDLKALRSKCLFNEVESAYAARRPGPHLVADYGLRTRHEAIKIVRDAAELLIHHARRQTGIQKAEKRRIKQLLRHFLPDLFAHPRQPLSDDERDEEKEEPNSPGSPSPDQAADDKGGSVKQEKQESSESDNASDKSSRNNKNDKENKPKNNNTTDSKESTNSIKRSSSNEDSANMKIDFKSDQDVEDDYRDHPSNEARFVCTSSWYLFLRLHGILCQRLGAARRAALALAQAETSRAAGRPPSVAAALRLKPSNLPMEASSPAEYYNALLELVKGVLDGNVDANAYEDAAREMLGIKAYPAYTLDKLVSTAVRQLQHCVSESWSSRAAELASRGMRGSAAYVRRALRALRAHHTAFLVRVYGGDDCKVTFELLEAAGEGHASPHHDSSRLSPTNQSRSRETNGEAVSRLAAWSLYAESYARAAHGQRRRRLRARRAPPQAAAPARPLRVHARQHHPAGGVSTAAAVPCGLPGAGARVARAPVGGAAGSVPRLARPSLARQHLASPRHVRGGDRRARLSILKRHSINIIEMNKLEILKKKLSIYTESFFF
ncbi:paired amphipathic helix protein Sin3a isoform X3 [Nymphalis io]|uniref:paired amphipathic helix protein Sin3a isoform X3 n=1 Tax=Inachis io TaxID=171585 RepID=UPI002166E8C3|nr:paired amphipathic helix protein Sin3a isoform X3 [Nymphalis io]